MDVINLIAESLQIVYMYIPQEIVILILACLVMAYLQSREDRNSAE